MSEHEQSIAYDPAKIAKALGSRPPIYVGSSPTTELITGATWRKVQLAVRGREIAERAEPDDAIANGISSLARLVDPGPEADPNLTDEQRKAIADGINSLTIIYQRRLPIGDHALVIKGLYNTYFDYQTLLTDTPAAGILRNLGDDYALQTGFDLGRTWEIYQQALEEANSWPQ